MQDRKENLNTETQDMVIYTDGSCKPNPGFIGYGFHGYTFKTEAPQKSFGGKGYRLTRYGYVAKDKDKEHEQDTPSVTPIKVFDGYGSCLNKATNNTAEVLGVAEALRLGLKEPIKSILIKTDSEYARRGYTEWMDKWASNNWMNREGQYIANLSNWKEVFDLRNKLQEKNIDVSVEWVKGHIGHPGNEKADKLANIGRINSEAKNEEVNIVYHDGANYWSQNMATEKHPLICKPWMYMRGMRSSHIAGEYYFGNIGKDKDFLGKRDPDGSYAIVQFKQPDALLDAVRNAQINKSNEDLTIYVVNLRALFMGDRAKDLLEFGDHILARLNPRRRDLYFIDSASEITDGKPDYVPKDIDEADSTDEDADDESVSETSSQAEPLTREQIPQKLSARVFDVLTFLKDKLEDYKRGNTRFCQYYDITNEFYQVETKLVKKTQVTQSKLKSSFKVGCITHDVKIQYENQDIPIRLNLSIDTPDRNALKRLEVLNPKLTLAVWKESEVSIRYAVIIECDGAVGIWCGFYSNLIFLTKMAESE